MSVSLSAASAVRARDAYRQIEKLASGPTGSSAEKEIVSLLEGLTPQERGEAVRLINAGSDHVTTDHILTDDIDDAQLRAAARRLLGEAEPFNNAAGKSIISDVDKTLIDSSGKRYPGVKALYEALGSNDGADMHIVSARPLSFLLPTKFQLNEIPHNSVNYGATMPSFFSLFGKLEGVRDEKVRDCLSVFARNPERSFTLVGDTGQADPDVYREVLNQKPDQVGLVLIHEVDGRAAAADLKAHPKVVCFSDYADAARQLAARGDITPDQLRTVLSDFAAGT